MNINLTPYVKSLYELGIESKNLSYFIKYAKSLNEFLKDDNDFISFLADPNVNFKEKKEFLDKVFKGTNSTYFKNWLLLLIEKRYIRNLKSLILSFINLYNKEKGILEGIIFTTYPLKKAELSNIEKIFESKLKRDIFFQNKVDTSLVSGIKVQIGDSFWENSVVSNLNLMLSDLLNN